MAEEEQMNNSVTEPAAEAKIDTIAEQISSEALLQTIDEKLNKMNRVDYLTISVNRTGLIVGTGILLILLWLLPLINFGLGKLTKGQFSLANLQSDVIFGVGQIGGSAACLETKPEIRLRLKTNNNSLSDINRIELKLRQAGFKSIETVFDPGITNKGVLIVTPDSEQVLREQIASTLKDSYVLSSESATLTEDSDFTAAILVGSDSAIPTTE